jgi:hypothetical protein
MSIDMNGSDLKAAERLAFRAATDTGLWDILIAAVLSILALGPMLSPYLGDFWSAAAFLPVVVGVYLGIRVVHERVVVPRVGVVRFGAPRLARMQRLTAVMLVVNVVALALGVFAAVRSSTQGYELFPVGLALVLLVGFSAAAQVLGVPRYFHYGGLLLAAPLVGEELWQRGLVAHHGFPVVFGVAAVVILAGGLLRFLRHVVRAGPEAARPVQSDTNG